MEANVLMAFKEGREIKQGTRPAPTTGPVDVCGITGTHCKGISPMHGVN